MAVSGSLTVLPYLGPQVNRPVDHASALLVRFQHSPSPGHEGAALRLKVIHRQRRPRLGAHHVVRLQVSLVLVYCLLFAEECEICIRG